MDLLHPSTWKPPLQDDESVMDAQATHDQVGGPHKCQPWMSTTGDV